jgi:hypothetical protein
MRKAVVASVVAAIATTATFSVAGAVPPGLEKQVGEEWDCGGTATTIFTAGRNGWVGDTQYHAVTFSVEGTFTPTGGEPEPVSFSKTWANGRGADSPEAITCTQEINESGPDGTFVAHAEVTAVPVH